MFEYTNWAGLLFLAILNSAYGVNVVSAFVNTHNRSSLRRIGGCSAKSDNELPTDAFKLLENGLQRYRARVAYDGSRYSGFQLNPNKRTVQGDLEAVLSRRFNRSVRVVAAGRTDAGVHARGQAIHFDLKVTEIESRDEIVALERSLQKMLPNEVTLWDIRKTDPVTKIVEGMNNNKPITMAWSVMYDSIGKLYVYRIAIGTSMDPILRHNRWLLPYPDPPDMDLFRECLRQFEGSHDFRAFATGMEQLERRIGGKLDTRRTVYRVELIREDTDRLYRIEIHLKGALYKMVRNMVGTALQVAYNKFPKEEFDNLLDGIEGEKQRWDNPCKPAPAHGLTLERVYFEDD